MSTFLIGNILLIILGLLCFFHLLVLFGVIPPNMVWAGKIKSKQELVRMEMMSLFTLIIVVIIISIKINYLKMLQNSVVIDILMWGAVAIFALNTIGNLFAKSSIEKYGFGILTMIISFLLIYFAIG